MAEVLGLGVTHGPYVIYPEEGMAGILRRYLASPATPEALKQPSAWPAPMRAEWGEDEGRTAAHTHRMRLVEGFRRARAVLDDFRPDVVVIWGDDQFENFREDLIPTFCVFIQDEFTIKPFTRGGAQYASNVWGEGADYELTAPGARKAARELAVHLLDDKIDIAYAYKQLHHDFAHAFWRTVAHLDYDRAGWTYPIIPFHVNCYGNRFTGGQGGEEFDPPGPSPERCFEVGASVARWAAASPYRVALIGSSSWSHAFLTAKHHFLWPDVESDRQRFAELEAGDYEAWRRIPISQIEECGQGEMLNWMCLAGAMQELGRKPAELDFVESWVFNSCKTFAVFP